jgi:hypothetical protein
MIGLLQLGTGNGRGMCLPIVSSGLLVRGLLAPKTRAARGGPPPAAPETPVTAPAVRKLVATGLRRRPAALAAERSRCWRDRAAVPAGAERAGVVCAAALEVEEGPTTPADAALATGSELVALAAGVSLGDVVTPPLGLLGVLLPAGDSDGSVTGVVEIEPVPELETLTLGVDVLTLGVVTLTTGVVTVTLGTVTVTLGTDTPTGVSPRIGRLGSVTVGSVMLGSDRSISGAAREVEEPAWLAPEDEPTREDSSPLAWASAQPSARNAAQTQTSVTATATALPRKRAAAILKRLAQWVNGHSCACL